MTNGRGQILEIRLGAGGISAVVEIPAGMRPATGQYLLAFAPESTGLLAAALFPARFEGENQVEFAAPLPEGWSIGTELNLRGPLGRGFRLPVEARRVALAALGPSAGALLPLAEQALGNQAEVAIYCDAIPTGLPPSVEVLPADLLNEAAGWSDYLAVDLLASRLSELPHLFGLRPHQFLPGSAEVLVRSPMPCGGTAECGVCAVHTAAGWKLGCKDGPVFAVNELLRV